MADSATVNYEFILPEPNGSDNSWGVKLNENWSAADTLLNTMQSSLTTIGGRITTAESEIDVLSERFDANTYSFGSSNFDDGWYKLPNGLIYQWGRVSANSSSIYVSFHKSISRLFSVQLTTEADSGNTGGIDKPNEITGTPTTSGFTATVNTGTEAFLWFAIGLE